MPATCGCIAGLSENFGVASGKQFRYLGVMENTIQPILCCVGAEVAGEPTQFLMERAFGSAHFDWRVITVEVSVEQLPRAWEGMNVMRFRAVRFFQAHHAAAMQLVTTPTPIDLFIGGITSAHRVGDQWTMWHNSGPALKELLSSRHNLSRTICWIHGDSPRNRSFLAACANSSPQLILWTGASAELPADISANLNLQIIPSDHEGSLVEILSNHLGGDPDLSGSAEVPEALVHCGEVDPRHFEILLNAQPASASCTLTVVSQSPGTRRKLVEQWQAGEVAVLTAADLIVAEEAYDHARWTGQVANIEVLREAYEEYADF